MNKVEIVADSKNTFGQRITSMVVTFPRMLLAEVNTHRMFSRNSASSRAIRFEKMVEQCKENPFIPFRFQKDHPGMQGTEYFEGKEAATAKNKWLHARDGAIKSATSLHGFGVTKQLANRILEPFMYHTALITATEWENFINLRVSPFAEDHFQDLSEKILTSMNESEPVQLKPGEWHIPFGDKFNDTDLLAYLQHEYDSWASEPKHFFGPEIQELKVKLATVRCARISYLTQGKETSIEDDLKLHDRLASSGHWSAFEHCARTMSADEYEQFGLLVPREWPEKPQKYFNDMKIQGICGNFQGFIQYRKMFADENRQDSRLIKK